MSPATVFTNDVQLLNEDDRQRSWQMDKDCLLNKIRPELGGCHAVYDSVNCCDVFGKKEQGQEGWSTRDLRSGP